MRSLKTILALLILAVVIGVATRLLVRTPPNGEGEALVIPRKSSLAQVARILEQNGVIEHADLFKWVLRLTRGASKVRAGEFEFVKGMRWVDALYVLYYSEPILHPITIPEGLTLRQIAPVIASAGLGDPKKFLDLTLTTAAAAKYKIKAPSLEGFLFPDTYSFSKIDGEERIIDTMVQGLLRRWNKEFKADAGSSPLSFEQVITLASIIEKETGVAEERPLVSSVFYNRMQKHMRLQSDPTTIYGISDFNGNLTKADLQRYTPYNTYTIPALPPGPIASPGEASIRAALHPAKTEYLYFVSNNHGSHIFSKTYSQHARQVTTWQKEYFSKRLGVIGK